MIDMHFEKDKYSEYMILKRQNQDIHTTYEEGILHNNQVLHVLDFNVRENNSEVFYYMDIRFMKDFKLCIECNGINEEDIRRLFCQIRETADLLGDYLLSKNLLCLQPTAIYRNMKNDDFYFVCLPGHDVDFEQQIRELLAWLMKHMDYNNKALVAYVFELFRKQEAGEDIFLQEEADALQREIEEDHEVITEDTAEIEPIVYEEEMPQEDLEERMPFHSIAVTLAAITLIATMFFVLMGKSLSFWVREMTGMELQPWIWPLIVFVLGILITLMAYVFYPGSRFTFNLVKPKKKKEKEKITHKFRRLIELLSQLRQLIGN